jgi:7-keto-8-aminopelargonate synthetase-like enzyme
MHHGDTVQDGSLCSTAVKALLSHRESSDESRWWHAGNSLATIGGFCAGSREIVDHQRLR